MSMEPETLACALAGRCGGCPWIGRTISDQISGRLHALRALWSEVGLPEADLDAVTVHEVGDRAVRDKVDLSLRRAEGSVSLGLRGLLDPDIVDQETCPLLTPELQAWVDLFRSDLPPVPRAAVRLRVAPDGARGLWLDTANVTIKALLDEGDWLRRVLDLATVEIGQRWKRATVEGDRVRLRDPQLYPWFETWVGAEERAVPLYSAVGGFSQSGLASNRVLVRRVREAIGRTGANRWVELGCGSGNLTLPLAAEVERVMAIDIDPLALSGLTRSAAQQGLADRVVVERASLAGAGLPWLEGATGALVDPPRSGLGPAVHALIHHAPTWVLYVSCDAGSLVTDLRAMADAGYQVESVEGVDQFPHSPHGEWVTLLRMG